MGFPGGSEVKNPPANVGNPGLIPGLGISPGEGNGNPLLFYCLENSIYRGAWLTIYSPRGGNELDMTELLTLSLKYEDVLL